MEGVVLSRDFWNEAGDSPRNKMGLRVSFNADQSTTEGGMARFESSIRKKALLHKDSLKHHLQDYCASTSIHGVKYLGNTTTIVEKCWWAAMLICCMVGNAYLIHKVWTKWNDSPVIVSFAETAMPIWKVPFPAITFCSESKSRADMFNFTEEFFKMKNESVDLTDEEAKRLADMSLLCDYQVVVDGPQVTDNSTIEFLLEVASDLEDSTIICRFGATDLGELLNCSQFFKQIFTDEGVCYSFNMLSASELFRGYGNPHFAENEIESSWSLENGYDIGADLFEAYPKRVISAGATTSMNVVLKFRSVDADFLCRGPVRGYKVLLHNPGEFPLVRERHWRAPPSQEILLMVQPRIMTTSDGLRPYSPQIRQCFFPSERYLAHFQIYTQRNCEVECLTNYTLNKCGCVALYMPRNETTKLCGAGSKICMRQAESELQIIEINAARDEKINSKCNCLQACQSIQYDAETSQADYEARGVLTAYGDNSSEFYGFDITRVRIFFKDMQFTTSRRSELFGPVDFLANVGGLLGLFCGISLLSICELVYYITIRLWANFRLIKKRHESMDKDDPTVSVNPAPTVTVIDDLKSR